MKELMGRYYEWKGLAFYRVERYSFPDGGDIFYEYEYHKVFGIGKKFFTA